MSVYFTADLHLGHEKIADHRGHTSIEEHDQAIMDTIVALPHGSHLWVLGDLTIGRRRDEDKWLRELGVVAQVRALDLHLVPGNHDSCHPMHRDSHRHQRGFLHVFESVQPFARRRIAGHDVLLSHFPYQGDHTAEDRATQYRLRDEGLWLLHGHTHSSEKRSTRRQIHVGWDAWQRPAHLDEIVELIESGDHQ
ncbi:metallophosphoesterase [Rhodococcus marinonascens]|uniref:metallophosphoesterase n=1 Tax=Rhodococcus marinonascens TaxID=38311 RepID=UPI000934B58C|nr:metallophosphoesterase [Rhodococcus marinonascens]